MPVANLADLIRSQAERRPERVALVVPASTDAERRELTWAALDAQVDAVARGLAARGLVAGHRVALIGPNSAEFVIGYFAALRAGFVVVPVNPQSTAHELAVVLADSGARLLLADPTHPGVAEGARLPVVALTPAGLAEVAATAGVAVDSPHDREALAVLLYTAGTSGRPKAAMLTHRALVAHLEHVDALGLITADSTVLGVLPLFHVFGLNAVLGGWAIAGATLIVLDGYGPAFLEALRSETVDNLPVSPALLDRLLRDGIGPEGLGSVRTVISGAAPLTDALRAAFVEQTSVTVEQGYGLTEAGPGVSLTRGQSLGHGHVGRALPGVEIRIGDGSEPAEPGEVFVRGDNLFSGYWPDGHDAPAADGWLGTGDIGYLDGEELFLVDRARELILVNGFNVYPAEVEAAIRELDGVEAVAVVGQPDERSGERVVAFVVAPGRSADDVEAHCAVRLAKFKRPSTVRLVDELPRGATGKVQKGILRHDLLEPR